MVLEAREPKIVKPNELMEINPVYVNLTDNPEEFAIETNITYLWVLKPKGDGTEIIVGIEEPWNQKGVFDESVHSLLDKMKEIYEEKKKIWASINIKDGMGGHPTLASVFNDLGMAFTTFGKAYLGGELVCSNGIWTLTNKSGRFGRAAEITSLDSQLASDVAGCLVSVASQMEVLINNAKDANIEIIPIMGYREGGSTWKNVNANEV